ncbi:hypothetical protein F5Y17DRAFT_17339 [Xylariaceae sp. FL0594]|nr:hypothetical protein F5Y17DRAFT_17339 [Xylariaceae sp. FL0594]
MKLNSFLLPALAGVATAESTTPSHAETYMLRHGKQSTTTASEPPSIPDSLARSILLQRLSSPEHPSALCEIAASLAEDEAISYVNAFGKPPRPLFASSDSSADDEPKQLVVAFSGITSKNVKQLKAAIPGVPATFTAPGLGRLPVEPTSNCAFGPAVDPKGKEAQKCWGGNTQYLQYDVSSDANIIKQLSANLETLKSYADQGVMETTIVFLDPTASSNVLHKRYGVEKVMTDQKEAKKDDNDFPFVTSAHGSSSSKTDVDDSPAVGRPSGGPIPACFATQSACESATNSCSGHGVCVDRWGGEDTEASCFSCHCKKTHETANSTSVTSWGGPMCQKRDVSVPFWLLTTVSLTLVGAVALSIGLLFDVGEQKLPGVIGAGVSRSK